MKSRFVWKKVLIPVLILSALILLFRKPLVHIFIFQNWRSEPAPDITGVTPMTTNFFIKIHQDSIHVKRNSIQNPKGTIIYFHGNKGGLERWNPIAAQLCSLEYNVVVWDYPGYGESSGHATIHNFIQTGRQIFDELKDLDTTQNIIIYGRSLGTGIASALAHDPDVTGLVLETPYTSLKNLVQHHTCFGQVLMSEDIPSLSWIRESKKPILVLHGTKDRVIPYSMGKNFFLSLENEQKKWLSITGGRHDNLSDFPIYWVTLQSFLQEIHDSNK